jgi:hypothetical protein
MAWPHIYPHAHCDADVCSCLRSIPIGGEQLLCSGCYTVVYCSRECQKHHWKHLGHKAACADAKKERKSIESIEKKFSGFGGTGLKEPKNPCMVCKGGCHICSTLLATPLTHPHRLRCAAACVSLHYFAAACTALRTQLKEGQHTIPLIPPDADHHPVACHWTVHDPGCRQ